MIRCHLILIFWGVQGNLSNFGIRSNMRNDRAGKKDMVSNYNVTFDFFKLECDIGIFGLEYFNK